MPQQIPIVEGQRPSSFFVENGEIKFFDGVKTEAVSINAKDRQRMIQAMKIRDAVRKVLDIQVNDGTDEELKTAQFELNVIYDNYVSSYGYICEDGTLKKIFSDDSSYPLLRSLEEYGKDGYRGKSSIFSKRMIEPHRKPTHADSPADALAISMQEVRRVELEYMKSLTGKSKEELVESVLNIEAVPPYEPQNEIERKILACNEAGAAYFSFSRYYDEATEKYYDDYIESQKDNPGLMLQVALRHGAFVDYDKVSVLLADKPLLALEAIRLGRDLGYVKPADLLILGYLRAIDEGFSRKDVEHDLQLYDFLKKELAQYDGDIQAIQQQIDLAFDKSMRSEGGSRFSIKQTKLKKKSLYYYKNLFTYAKMQGGIVFATETPISNSNYRRKVNFRTKTRFAKFYNLPKLMSLFKKIADIKTSDRLEPKGAQSAIPFHSGNFMARQAISTYFFVSRFKQPLNELRKVMLPSFSSASIL